MRIAFTTLGCKVNRYDTENLSELFAADGYDIVDDTDDADVYVINSCTVTSAGDKKSLRSLRKLKREHPGALLVLTGCYPQAFPEEASQIKEASVITGTKSRKVLLSYVKEALASGKRIVDIAPHDRGEAFEEMAISSLRGRTRAFLKIEDGCERYCSYCIIPTARGPVRSKPIQSIQKELAALAQNGYREAVLTGINLSSYGKDLGLRLIDAVKAASAVEGIQRIRLGSLEPELLSDEDIAGLAALPKLCPQFHLALQSGCDATLKSMNRHYDTAEYRRIAQKIRSSFDNPSLTTDIMVGFPGETEEDFAASLEFVREMDFAKAHVFAYSKREGTAAARRDGQIPTAVKEDRSRRMIALSDETRNRFLESQVGRIEEVLMETTRDYLGLQGFTRNYTPVSVDCDDSLAGQLIKVKLIGVLDGRCLGLKIE